MKWKEQTLKTQETSISFITCYFFQVALYGYNDDCPHSCTSGIAYRAPVTCFLMIGNFCSLCAASIIQSSLSLIGCGYPPFPTSLNVACHSLIWRSSRHGPEIGMCILHLRMSIAPPKALSLMCRAAIICVLYISRGSRPAAGPSWHKLPPAAVGRSSMSNYDVVAAANELNYERKT